ncbi:hypothetical protein Ciccas_006851 [Cichlidogyrus casuarinus]|uniref:Uncharacterized protein n=1 Tax=Cichlidogyrus casuarinus TaxID=1844966 RepID=A0ABD2Q4M6_9PLAT
MKESLHWLTPLRKDSIQSDRKLESLATIRGDCKSIIQRHTQQKELRDLESKCRKLADCLQQMEARLVIKGKEIETQREDEQALKKQILQLQRQMFNMDVSVSA